MAEIIDPRLDIYAPTFPPSNQTFPQLPYRATSVPLAPTIAPDPEPRSMRVGNLEIFNGAIQVVDLSRPIDTVLLNALAKAFGMRNWLQFADRVSSVIADLDDAK